MQIKMNAPAIIVASIIVIAIAAMGFSGSSGNLGGDINDLSYDGITNGATTTRDFAYPVKVLAGNGGRQYARICNDSDTIIYMHLDDETATSTMELNEGIRLDVQGTANSCYEILPSNLYYGSVWATSTLPAKNIIFVEK